jgi:hypothetical protein
MTTAGEERLEVRKYYKVTERANFYIKVITHYP